MPHRQTNAAARRGRPRQAPKAGVTQRLHGVLMQDASTDELIFGVPTRVAYCSSVCTLEPADLILTGTPGGAGYFRDPPVSLAAGDVAEVAIEGIGTVSNAVAAAKAVTVR